MVRSVPEPADVGLAASVSDLGLPLQVADLGLGEASKASGGPLPSHPAQLLLSAAQGPVQVVLGQNSQLGDVKLLYSCPHLSRLSSVDPGARWSDGGAISSRRLL